VKVALKILDPRLLGWVFLSRGTKLAAGPDLHVCIDSSLLSYAPKFSTSVSRREGGFGPTGVEAACPDLLPARHL
jgi:hypothetical protein